MVLRSLLVVSVVASSASAQLAARGPVTASLTAAAQEAGVPADLLTAIAIEEGGVYLAPVRDVHDDDHVPVAGALELRHGRRDTLALGARLMGTTEEALRQDTELGTRAGARVLAHLGAEYGAGPTIASWRRALEVMSGMDDASAPDYASRVFARLRTGGQFPARNGELIALLAHAELGAADVAQRRAALVVPAAAEYPGAIWFQTSCTDKCSPGRPNGHASVNKIIVHDTEGGWNASVATLQYDTGKSVHYIIDADGSRVGQFRSENDTTYHGGNLFYNQTSIGIEHVGTAANPNGYTPALYATSRSLVKSIRTRWTVPLDRGHIIGHYQIPDGMQIAQSSAPCSLPINTCESSPNYGGASNHRDPGVNWQWCQYMEQLGGSCTCNDAYNHWNCTTDKTEAVRCVNGVVEVVHCVESCQVMPIGVDDVCHETASEPPPEQGSGSDAVDPPDEPESGGCGVAGGGGGSLLLVALVLVRRRRGIVSR